MTQPKTPSPSRRGDRGFSLLEVLVVLGIISILSAIGIVSVKDTLNQARAARTVSDLLIVSNVVEQYALDHGDGRRADHAPGPAHRPSSALSFVRRVPVRCWRMVTARTPPSPRRSLNCDRYRLRGATRC